MCSGLVKMFLLFICSSQIMLYRQAARCLQAVKKIVVCNMQVLKVGSEKCWQPGLDAKG
jgi:hypothetical protein